MGYNAKVHRKQGGDELVVESGGKISVETGGDIEHNGVSLIDEIAALSGLDSGELGVLNGVTAGTVTASKALVVDANKDLATLRHVTLSGNLVHGTTTLAETDTAKIDGITNGTQAANKAVVADANVNTGVAKVTELHIGASGAEVQVTASPAQLNSCDANVGAAAGTGVVAVESGFGNFKTTVLTLTDVEVPLVDEAGQIAYGGLKVYDFPQGYIYTFSALTDLDVTKSSAGVNDDWDGDFGLGTATAGNDADLTTTEQDVLPKTDTPQAAAGATTADGVSTATEQAIHDGTGTAKDLFINFLVDDADHDVTSTPCNLILNGTIELNWIFMGDN